MVLGAVNTPQKAQSLVSYAINESNIADDPEEEDEEIEGPQPMDISDEEKDSARSQSPVNDREIDRNRDKHSILPPEPEGHCSKALQVYKFGDTSKIGVLF